MDIRLQKFLADAGIASRRAAEKLIEEGAINVNGKTIRTQGVKINPDEDKVFYNGKLVKVKQKLVYYMLHKPIGVITSAADEKDRKTVLDIVNVQERIFPIGRLDYMSSGLLLLTNDGDLTYKLTHPKHNIDKKYIATIEPKVTKDKIAMLEKGADLGVYKTAPCKITCIADGPSKQTYEVNIHEGKNRQIRRMFEYIDSRVIKLQRVSIGDITLGNLKEGHYRALTNKELDYLKKL